MMYLEYVRNRLVFKVFNSVFMKKFYLMKTIMKATKKLRDFCSYSIKKSKDPVKRCFEFERFSRLIGFCEYNSVQGLTKVSVF